MKIEQISGKIMRFTWTLANGETGEASDYPEYADRNIQCFGTFGVGGTVIIEGSNDKTNWTQLNDLGSSLLKFTSAGIKMIQENTLYIRPRVTDGDGATDLTLIGLARRPHA